MAPNDARRREVRAWDERHQRLSGCFGVVNQVGDGIADFGEVVGRDVGRHADGDAGRSVDQHVGQPGWQHRRLRQRIVEVGSEVDGVEVEVGEQLFRDRGQTGLGVPHGGGRVIVYAAEVALAVHQGVAHAEVLRHTHKGVVHRRVAVGMVLAQDLPNDPGALLVSGAGARAYLVHGIENSPLHGL